MTIDNKLWLRTRILRLYLFGLTQEEISREVGISEGTTNAILQELMASDDTLELQREMAVVCKKTGLSPKQLASNMRMGNAIARMGYDKDNVYAVLQAIDQAFVQDGVIKEKFIAKLMLDISDLILKKGLNLGNLYSQVEAKFDQRDKLNEEIHKREAAISDLRDRKDAALTNYQTTLDELEDFGSLIESFEEAGLDISDKDEVKNVLRGFKEQGDPVKIVNQLKHIGSLKLTKQDLELQCETLAEMLEALQKRQYEFEQQWAQLSPAIGVVSNLLQSGVSPINISQMFQIPYLFENPLILPKLYLELEKYGKLSVALLMKQREYQNILNSMSSMNKMLK